jgi:CHAT domain-containing protein/tetratricopeptide (TPR) repeat protein
MSDTLARCITLSLLLAVPWLTQAQPTAPTLSHSTDADERTALIERAKAVTALRRKSDLVAAEAAGDALLADMRATLGDDDPITLDQMFRVSETRRNAGRYASALALADEAARRLRNVSGERAEATLRARIVLGSILFELGRLRDAVAVYEDVARLASDPDLALARRYANGELALTYSRLGRLGDAAVLGERNLQEDLAAGRLATELGYTNLDNLAGVYLDLGRFDEGVDLQRRAMTLYLQELGADDYRTLTSRMNLLQALKMAGLFDEAIEVSQAMVAARARTDQGMLDRNRLVSHNIVVSLLIDRGRLDEAQREIETVRPLWHQLLGAKDPGALDVDYYEAIIAFERGRIRESRDAFKRVCDVYAEVGDAQASLPQHCPIRLAHAEWRLGERAMAAGRLGAALDAFEQRAADGLLTDLSQQGLFAGHARYFRRLMEWHIELGNVAQAFALSERLRARSLLQSIVFRHADDSAAILPAEETARIAELRAAVSHLEQEAAHEPQIERKLAVTADRDARFRELVAAREALKQRYPRYAALAQPVLVDALEAAKHLPPNTDAIVYAFGENRLHAFVVTARGPLRVVDLGARAPLVGKITAWRALLAMDASQPVWRSPQGEWQVGGLPAGPGWRRQTDWRPLARTLGRELLEPLLSSLGRQTHWLIVPDGVLAQVPFEPLQIRGEPAVARHSLRYVQSLSVMAALTKRKLSASGASVLTVGDPDYASTAAKQPGAAQRSGRAGAFDAAVFVRGMADDATVARRTYDRLGIGWSALPGTRVEVEAVTRAFAGKRVVRLVGRDASEATLQRLNASGDLRRFRYLHFATHGYLSLDVPALSAIVLSQNAPTATADGYITAAEWPAYELDSDLIVLSGCETGRGRAVDGEGIMGLPYALFVAGNRNAVLTLWKVADDSSARFVARFMRQVAAGVNVADALARTKREFARDPRHAHPLHWAGFVQYGS